MNGFTLTLKLLVDHFMLCPSFKVFLKLMMTSLSLYSLSMVDGSSAISKYLDSREFPRLVSSIFLYIWEYIFMRFNFYIFKKTVWFLGSFPLPDYSLWKALGLILVGIFTGDSLFRMSYIRSAVFSNSSPRLLEMDWYKESSLSLFRARQILIFMPNLSISVLL